MAVRYDFDLSLGNSWPLGDGRVLTAMVKQGPDVDSMVALDLSGATITSSFSERENGASLFSPTVAILNQTTHLGQFTFRIPSVRTTGLTLRTYHYRVTLNWAGTDSKLDVLAGKIRIVTE